MIGGIYSKLEGFFRPYRAWIFLTLNPGRRSLTRFALGYYLSGFQPF